MPREEAKKEVIKRRQNRVVGVFVDGTGLDRATRRINRRVDLSALIRGVTSGVPVQLARYYTLIPFEDDSRHRAFLDAVGRAGLSVVVKRLPPKGVTRQVSVEVEMAADIIAFALGHTAFTQVSLEADSRHSASSGERGSALPGGMRPGLHPAPAEAPKLPSEESPSQTATASESKGLEVQRVITVVCPSRDLSYPIALAGELGIDTVTADFGHFGHDDAMRSAAKWIDLSSSETIWKD